MSKSKHVHAILTRKTTHRDEHGIRTVEFCECGARRTVEMYTNRIGDIGEWAHLESERSS